MDSGFWVHDLQGCDQVVQALFLLRCAGVAGMTLGVEAAHVADAYAVGVVSLAVRALVLELTTFLHMSVQTDDVVVADALEASLLVPAVNLLGTDVHARRRGGAVDDDFIDGSHVIHGFVIWFFILDNRGIRFRIRCRQCWRAT